MQQHSRRNFLKGLAALVGGVALEQAIPFNRVWSFPKDIRLANARILESEAVPTGIVYMLNTKYIDPALADAVFKPSPLMWYLQNKYIYNPQPRMCIKLEGIE